METPNGGHGNGENKPISLADLEESNENSSSSSSSLESIQKRIANLTGQSPVKVELITDEGTKEKEEHKETNSVKDDDAHSLSGKSVEDDGIVIDPKEEEEEELEDKKDKHEEIDPALKEKGEKVKKTGINRVLRRRPKHKPRWNIYPAVHVNKPDINKQKGFPSNQISTTKYTWWNFIPKNLFEQFRRATNFYFLFIVILTFIRQISPLTPITSIVPLLFVLGVAALKEAYEDYGRFRADQKVNNRKFTLVSRDGKLVTRESKNLKVGDVLYLQKNETIPADTILISSGLEDGVCYVETSQLDGESNLKLLRSIKETAKLSKEEVATMDARIESEEPHSLLYTFNGRLVWDGKTHSLDTSQLLLRGAAIRNTNWACGVIAYTGKDTKLSLNQKEPPSKFSRVEKSMNRLVIYIFIFKFLCTIVLGVLTAFFQASDSIRGAWYLADFSTQEVWYGTIVNYFSYFILLSFLIPQSMMVTLEIVKVFQARLMEWDPEMEIKGDDGERKPMAAKTSNLNDELALVNYVFSDKTGTLTQNKMVFGTCSINGTIYEESAEGKLPEFLKSQGWTPEKHNDKEQSGAVADFLRVLSICHSVVTEENPKTGELSYQAQSPDEAALCDAGKINGFVFKGRKTTEVSVDEVGHLRKYEILCQLEFTSARARMSTIVRTPEGEGLCPRGLKMLGKIIIYAKGADSIMFKRLNNSNPKLLEITKGHITIFSTRGLRTLALGKRELREDEYKKWAEEYHEAITSLVDRETKVAAVCEKIERDFELIGCTAIEDKLQDGVPEAIKYLLEAGMKVWVITGDKQETAINIGIEIFKNILMEGYSTNLLKTEQKKVIINVGDAKNPNLACQEQLQKALDEYLGKTKELGLVIDGASLVYALKEHAEMFLKITSCCSSVVCCRVTPLQKAEIVRLIKTSDKKLVTLSIGDGANDVSMIQEAHIGIGIFGKEGTQAARASDYSLQQFSHLKRLICVHGRYSVIRNASCIYSSLYKNLAFFFVSFWFAFFCGFTAQTIYDDWVVTFYNIFVTSLPPLLMGIMEKDIVEETIERNPSTYKFVQAGNGFTMKAVFGWMFAAFYHSIVIFGGGFLLIWMNDLIRSDGGIGDIWNLGHILATAGVFTVLGKITIETKYWTGVGYTGMTLSVLAYIVVLILITSWNWFWPQGYFVWYNNLVSAVSYLTILGTIVAALFPDLAWAFFLRSSRPRNWMILQESYVLKSSQDRSEDIELPVVNTKTEAK